MLKYMLPSILIASLCLTACSLQSRETVALSFPTAADCPLTQPPERRFIPPEPYPEYPGEGMFWFGNNGLWTAVPDNATWQALPHDEQGYTQKLFWWSQKYKDEEISELRVTGQQLDGAATFTSDQATSGYHFDLQTFMLTGGKMPTAGCWQITGNFKGESLSYVVWIEP